MSIITPAYDRAAGIAEISRCDIVVCRRTLCVSTIGVSPVTVIVSCEGADLHVRVDRRGERAGQLDAFALDGAEAGQAERDGVGARPQIDDTVLARTIGDGRSDFLDQHVARRFDGHAWQHGAGRVLDDAGDGRLGECRRRQNHQAREAEQNPFNTRIHSPLFRSPTRHQRSHSTSLVLLHYVAILGRGRGWRSMRIWSDSRHSMINRQLYGNLNKGSSSFLIAHRFRHSNSVSISQLDQST